MSDFRGSDNPMDLVQQQPRPVSAGAAISRDRGSGTFSRDRGDSTGTYTRPATFIGEAAGSAGLHQGFGQRKRSRDLVCGCNCRTESKSVFSQVARWMVPMLLIIFLVYCYVVHEVFNGGHCNFTSGFCTRKCWITIFGAGVVLVLNLVVLFIIMSNNPCACTQWKYGCRCIGARCARATAT